MTAVTVNRLSKHFRIARASGTGNRQFGYRTLRNDLVRLASWPVRAVTSREPAAPAEDFWALRDVEFKIPTGEVVGIVGHNGAGKSTLLKILSRITKPTSGEALLRGRVGSLLEVGTGFHPELTGRENIFLNGAILGMRREEIHAKFDAIVAFAEIGPFLDTPVKRYSSGMYVRLAFAVAAHLEPEILIVDEVLAVGDMAFQRKCLGRMREVGRSGATVLFVSHNMPAVESLCTRALLLDHGTVVQDGNVADVVREYHRRVLGAAGPSGVARLEDRNDPSRFRKVFRSATLLDASGNPTNFVSIGGSFHLRMELDCPEPVDHPVLGACIDDTLGQRYLSLHTPLQGNVIERAEGRCHVDCRVDPLPLAPGDYWIKLSFTAHAHEVDTLERALHFTVTDGDAFGEGRGHHRGVCVAPSHWRIHAS